MTEYIKELNMTHAEHLIENAIIALEKGSDYQTFSSVKYNLSMGKAIGLDLELVWQMAQHVVYTLKPLWCAEINEEHGILDLEEIKRICKKVLDEYEVEYCILFGSYAKGTATEKSDVDLLISSRVEGLRFFGLIEKLRTELHKKVDLLEARHIDMKSELYDDIVSEGIKIYGV